MFNIPSFFGFRAGGSVPLLLNEFPGAAAAYSLRLLDSTYLGDAIQVRESTGNTTLDIGFVNGELDTASLLAHCAGANGFVTEWYDQSGNALNATQGVALDQPQIVSSGSVILDNGKPTILFDGVNDVLEKTGFGFPTTNISIVKVGSRIGVSGLDGIGYSATPSGGFIMINLNTRIGFDGRPNGGTYNTSTASLVGTTDQILQFNIYDGSNLKASVDGGSFGTTAVSANPIIYGNQTLDIGAIRTINQFYNCNNSEFIIWATDESTNRTGIEDNINDFYSIY